MIARRLVPLVLSALVPATLGRAADAEEPRAPCVHAVLQAVAAVAVDPPPDGPAPAAKTARPPEGRPAPPPVEVKPLDVTAVSWELAAVGSTVTGELRVDVADAATDGTFAIAMDGIPSLDVDDIQILSSGVPAEDAHPVSFSPVTDPSDRKARSARRMAPAWAAEVSAGTLACEATVSLEADATDGVFRIEIPDLVAGCGPEAPARLPRVMTLTIAGSAEVHGTPSHPVDVEELDGATVLRVIDGGGSPGPVLLAWTLRQEASDHGIAWASDLGDGTTAVTLVIPPRESESLSTPGRVRRRDVVFVVDASSSMSSSAKLASAASAVAEAIGSLDPEDGVDVLTFNDTVATFSGRPASVAETGGPASQWVSSARAQGGTRLEPALRLGLQELAGSTRHAMLVVLTDGMIADEDGVRKALASSGHARVLLVAIGGDARPDVLRRLATASRGDAAVVGEGGSIAAALGGLVKSFSRPLAWDLELDGFEGEAEILGPAPDLYAGRALEVRARLQGPVAETIRLKGDSVDGDGAFELEVPVRWASRRP